MLSIKFQSVSENDADDLQKMSLGNPKLDVGTQ